ncbi:MAG: hypothetical protein WBJ33_02610 [Candidatus Nanopelagicales bacterium]
MARTGLLASIWSAMKAFLLLNDVTLAYCVDDAEEFVLQVARGEL